MSILLFLKSKIGQYVAIAGAIMLAVLSAFGLGKRKARQRMKEQAAEQQAETLEELLDMQEKHHQEDREAQAKNARGDRDALDRDW